jgi:glycerate-2-kinase
VEDDLKEILSAGLAAAAPKEAVLRSMRLEEDAVISGDERFEAERIFVLAAGKAAGAIRENGVDPKEAMENNDAYVALKVEGALLVTGPTGTNVNDLRVALVTGSEDGFE